MGEFDGLTPEKVEALAEIRTRIHNSVSAIVAIGEGGWNHGPKLMRAHADAMHQLKTAEALLAESAAVDADES